jgi:hypothetical protein
MTDVVNLNARIHGDGVPVPQRFAAVKGILTAALRPGEMPPLMFRHYI